MRITGNKPLSGVHSRGGKKKVDGEGVAFQPDPGGDGASAPAVSSSSAIQGMDALLALQEMRLETDQRQVATQRGHTLLDNLEALRAELLGGIVSEDRLASLAKSVEDRVESGDPQVDGVIREIELRVKVELAKLGRFSD
ncbi:hypothetical protein GCM10011316_06840 [Roseibium aquae]|uniref:Class II flagellar assembly regulator n=1 Tax=Roseibium aquae TaxID=1323746 RepID=A0A916TBT0_9HYPH|nr:flagellar assembly protein FliX [Roseibium aquae]GGB37352.1 hypothetical protein GCM10011316_06840 [Roseibium aquae]